MSMPQAVHDHKRGIKYKLSCFLYYIDFLLLLMNTVGNILSVKNYRRSFVPEKSQMKYLETNKFNS